MARLTMRPRALLIGCGALGLGFLAERLAPDYELCLCDVRAKEPLLGRIVTEQGFAVNVCAESGVTPRRTAGRLSMALADSDDALDAALADADLVLTATGRRQLDAVVARIAPALSARSRRVWLLFCENGHDLAATYQPAFGAAVVCVDTVMSRMCRWADADEPGYAPLWPGCAERLVVEDYDLLPLDAERCAEGPFGAAFTLVSPDEFSLWQDAKRYLHNGMHAYVAYHAALAGATRFPQAPRAIRREAREVMLSEVLPALLRAHPLARRDALTAYAEGLLARFFSATFNDSIARGVRGTADKLAPGERLLKGCDLIRRAGIEPVGYGSTVAAAHEWLRRTGAG